MYIFEKGVFLSILPTDETEKNLKNFMNEHLRNMMSFERNLHITLIYSRGLFKGDIELNNSLIEVKPLGFDLYGDKNDILVLKVDSPELIERNKKLLFENKLNQDYEPYQPHITLGFKLKFLRPIPKIDFPLYFEIEKISNLKIL